MLFLKSNLQKLRNKMTNHWETTQGDNKVAKNLYLKTLLIIYTVMTFLGGTEVFAQSAQGNPPQGKVLFEEHCMECHGRAGDGTGAVGYFLEVRPADLLSIESRMKTDDEVFTIIKKGLLFDEMHGWEEQLSDQDIRDVVSYIKILAPPLSQSH